MSAPQDFITALPSSSNADARVESGSETSSVDMLNRVLDAGDPCVTFRNDFDFTIMDYTEEVVFKKSMFFHFFVCVC